MNISFLYPAFLFLLLAVPLLWFLPRGCDLLQGIIRSLLMLLIIIVLARPVLLSADAKNHHVFILDRSVSIPAEQIKQGEKIIKQLRASVASSDNITQIIIGEAGEMSADLIINSHSTSSLSAALQAAAEQIPVGNNGSISLISDGLATDRNWARVVQSLKKRNIAVHTYDLGTQLYDVYPSAINTEAIVHVGQTVKVLVDVIGASDNITLSVSDEQGVLAKSESFSSDGYLSIPLEFEAAKAGYMNLTVKVTAQNDSYADNNELTKTIAIQNSLKVLYLGERQQQAVDKIKTLLGNGFDVSQPQQPLNASFSFVEFDIVMLDDLPAKQLPLEFQKHLIKTVQQKGLGLLYSGGKGAFGGGGYHETEIAKALPIDFTQKDEKKDPSVSLAIIIDSSGSMTGLPMELAKQIARLTVRRLKPQDRIGIVEFYGAKTWAVPMQSASNKIEIDRAIGRMQADGSTVLYPAIEEAYYGLKNMDTRFKHILVITDAGVEDAGFESLIRQLTKDGINLSTILVGDSRYSDIMFNMATWGKGQFYAVGDKFSLVEITLREPSTSKLPTYQNGHFAIAARGNQGWWGDVDTTSMPALKGYVEVKAKVGAEILIEEKNRTHPILASWRYGLGRVTALMTEPVGNGTSNWQDWQDYGQFLARILSRTASDTNDFSFQITHDDGQLSLLAKRLSEDTSLRPQAQVENGELLKFNELAPGIFVAGLQQTPEKNIRIIGGKHLAQRLIHTTGNDIFLERQVDPVKGLNLDALAELTGGHNLADNPEITIAADSQQMSLTLTPLWQYLLLLALLIYIIELIYRRWSINTLKGNIN